MNKNDLQTLQMMGLTLPTPAYLVGIFLFSIVGLAAYRYGRRTEHPKATWIGVALMLYPYVISQTWALYLVGAVLCGALYWFRE